jgi:hypothetical protein
LRGFAPVSSPITDFPMWSLTPTAIERILGP